MRHSALFAHSLPPSPPSRHFITCGRSCRPFNHQFIHLYVCPWIRPFVSHFVSARFSSISHSTATAFTNLLSLFGVIPLIPPGSLQVCDLRCEALRWILESTCLTFNRTASTMLAALAQALSPPPPPFAYSVGFPGPGIHLFAVLT